jgi:hypothetical protein
MDQTKAVDIATCAVAARNANADTANACGTWAIVARRGEEVLWEESGPNLIVNAGLTYLNGVALTAVAQITAWFVGLLSPTPTIAAADTMAAHAGWTEVVAYSDSTRKAWTGVAGAAGVSTNGAAPAVFTCDTNDTGVGGVFLTSVNTKGGATGTLFSGKAFAANRTLQSGDTLTVTYSATLTAS